MAALSAATIALIKLDYEESSLTVEQIGAKFDVSPSYVSRMARTHGWVLRSLRMGRKPRSGAPLSQEGRALIAHRLRAIINKHLDQMEKEMDNGTLDPAGFERNAKSATSMISGLEKVTTGADGEAKQGARAEKAVDHDTASEAGELGEVERLQREIIERFERIQRRREAEGRSE